MLQLDPSWFEDHCPEWRNEGLNEEAGRLTIAALNWASAEFGQANVVGGSIHLDEHSPQLQVMITPVTQDGRLSQKDFFKGPGDLKRQHRELRAHMEKIGCQGTSGSPCGRTFDLPVRGQFISLSAVS